MNIWLLKSVHSLLIFSNKKCRILLLLYACECKIYPSQSFFSVSVTDRLNVTVAKSAAILLFKLLPLLIFMKRFYVNIIVISGH